MALLDDIAIALQTAGVGTISTNIFKSSKAIIPTGDGPYLSLRETGGMTPARTQNETGTERPTAQLLAIAKNYVAARTMLAAAFTALGGVNGLHNVTLSGTFYLSIVPRQSITDLGLEEGTARSRCVFNIEVEKQPS